MRILMWFAAGFAVSCVGCSYCLLESWFLSGAVCAGMFALAVILAAAIRRWLHPSVVLLSGSLAGILWFGVFYAVYIQPVVPMDMQQVSLTFTATGESRPTDYGGVVQGMTVIEGKTYQLWVYLSEQEQLQPGDTVTGDFRIRLTTPGGIRESAVFQGKGIFLILDQKGEAEVSTPDKIPLLCQPARMAAAVKKMLKAVFPEDVLPFTKALLLGDTWDLDNSLDAAFKISGIRHVVAVSGLHISILYGIICVITLRRRILSAVLGIPVLVIFAAMAGFTPSALRACIMLSLMIIAQVFNREYDPLTALSVSVLLILLCNPMAAVSASLQLSCASVAGILLFYKPVYKWLREKSGNRAGLLAKIQTMVCGGIAVSISATSLTVPFCACYFGMVSLAGVFANLLTLWMVNLVFCGLVFSGLLYIVSPGMAAVLARVLSWGIRYVQWIAVKVASFPLAAVYTDSVYVVLWLVLIYVLLGAFLAVKRKMPGMLICCGVMGLCIALCASWGETSTADVRITMLDVGQGQSILLESEGKAFLVDCGGSDEGQTADTISAALLSRGIFRLDGIILTHYDRDHAGALSLLLDRVDTSILFLPDTQNSLTLPETEAQVFYVWEDMQLTFGQSRIEIYGPVYSGLDNENSLCVLFDTEKCDILITGDRSAFGERMLMRKRELPDVDILVAGHHGAADSTSEQLLRTVTPEILLISVAENNIYNHPAPELLQRLVQFGCTVYRTDEHGTITIRR